MRRSGPITIKANSRDYEVGYGKPPAFGRFSEKKIWQSEWATKKAPRWTLHIIRRWQAYSGNMARHAVSSEVFGIKEDRNVYKGKQRR